MRKLVGNGTTDRIFEEVEEKQKADPEISRDPRFRQYGGGGGNRTHIQRLRPVKSTRLAGLLKFHLQQVSKPANLAEN